jgi:hypothetical protein
MFRPYKAIFRQLFTNWNCRTAPFRMSMQPMLLHTVSLALNYVCFRMNTPSSLLVIFSLRRPYYAPSCVVLSLVGRVSPVHSFVHLVWFVVFHGDSDVLIWLIGWYISTIFSNLIGITVWMVTLFGYSPSVVRCIRHERNFYLWL